MSGLFGGYLSLVNTVGGAVLFVLIGSKAWTDNGRFFRLTFGSCLIGAVAGGLVGVGLAVETKEIPIIAAVGLMLSAIVTAMLEAIRGGLE